MEKGCIYRKSNCSAVKHVKNGKKGSGLITRIPLCVEFPFWVLPPALLYYQYVLKFYFLFTW